MANFLSPWERRNGVRVLLTSDALQRVVGTESGVSTSSTPASRPDYSSSRPHSSSPTAAALGSPSTYRGSAYDVASSRPGSPSPCEHRTTSDYPSTSSPVPAPSGFQDNPTQALSADRWTSTTPTHEGHLDLPTSAHRTPTQPTPPPRSPSPWWSSLPVYLHPYVSSDTDQPDTSTISAVDSATNSTAAARDRSPVLGPSHTPPDQTAFDSAYDSFVYWDDEGAGTNYGGSTPLDQTAFASTYDSFVYYDNEGGGINYSGSTPLDQTASASAYDSFVYYDNEGAGTNCGGSTPPDQTVLASAYDSFVYWDDEGAGTNYGGSTLTTEYRSGPRGGDNSVGGGGGGGGSHGGGGGGQRREKDQRWTQQQQQ
ncbi:hypothetical protein MYCTH_90513 [Thermothelomyces thermophilus ATCC 42464]|uniref:Uncharacterized protein n=1 Tax=Thermothelomyces thermophilus (strain ATCC 42464 / BCRC 31852 / DSM 1799) TaxID=573729 RepID=G2QMB9_THET4|nr:uncharacterized protein MYCTH_90513 [Thermothelomyces thermophilus ATCC 42464]AEO61099.1 hypothetical protein MYCTH_90513 [Thermothelomyces thermophilus ATCC 42464]